MTSVNPAVVQKPNGPDVDGAAAAAVTPIRTSSARLAKLSLNDEEDGEKAPPCTAKIRHNPAENPEKLGTVHISFTVLEFLDSVRKTQKGGSQYGLVTHAPLLILLEDEKEQAFYMAIEPPSRGDAFALSTKRYKASRK